MSRTSFFRTSSFRFAASYLALFTVSVLVLGAVIPADIDDDIKSETALLMREYAADGLDVIAELHGLACAASDNLPGLSITLSSPATGLIGR